MASKAYGSEPARRGSAFEMSANVEPRVEARPQPPPMESPATQQRVSVIGPSLVFKGKLTAEEDLLIQGRVEGFIDHNATNLTIGVHGAVKGDISANRLIIQGEVHGDVRASDAVIVEASARVYGNLFAPRVGLKDGATFKGKIDMSLPPTETASRAASRNGASQDPRSSQGEEFHGGKVNQLLESAGS